MDRHKMKKPAETVKPGILESLNAFDGTPLRVGATRLFDQLGYRSEKTFDLSPNTPENFLQTFDPHERFRRDKGLFSQWKTADILFQITDEEIHALGSDQLRIIFDSTKKIEDEIIRSYLFTAVELKGDHYTRTDLSNITREINRLFPMPVLVLFKIGETLTFSIINRRIHKKEASKDVLEKVTLIKDIRYESPHRAHIEILYDLSFGMLFDRHQVSDFVSLHKAWQKTLDTNELNRRFYKELANWYFWAVKNVTFPKDAGEDEDDTLENRGILPLPNLETNFVAANSLIGIEGPEQRTIRNLEIDQKEKELAEVRRRHFTARTPKTKAKYRALDRQLRHEISELLKEWGFPHETTEKLAYYDPYDQNSSVDYFDPEWMFGVTNGFNVTIGNPPYVRADSGEQHLSLRKTIEQGLSQELKNTILFKIVLDESIIHPGYF